MVEPPEVGERSPIDLQQVVEIGIGHLDDQVIRRRRRALEIETHEGEVDEFLVPGGPP